MGTLLLSQMRMTLFSEESNLARSRSPPTDADRTPTRTGFLCWCNVRSNFEGSTGTRGPVPSTNDAPRDADPPARAAATTAPPAPRHRTRGMSDDRDRVRARFRDLLRPVRLRDRRRPVPGLEAAARRAPLYYNEKYDFYAREPLRRRRAGPRSTGRPTARPRARSSSSSRPTSRCRRASIIFEDPPSHDLHRGLLSRVFTPRKMDAIEPKVREFCARSLDPLVGLGRLRLHRRPRRPDADAHDRHAARHPRGRTRRRSATRSTTACASTRAAMPDAGRLRHHGQADVFADYIDWRAEHPSDDLMTELLQAEFEDETARTRTLTRDEVLNYVNLHRRRRQRDHHPPHRLDRQGAGRAPRPAARAAGRGPRRSIPNAIEELLRYEAPSPVQARYVTERRRAPRPGRSPRAASCCCSTASANRDDRHFPDGDRFDIHRKIDHHLSLRLRHPLLPRRRAGPARGAGRPRRGAQALPRLGRRLGQRQAGPHLDRARLGALPVHTA